MIYGLDIGGTKIEIAIFDDSLQRQDSWRVPTPTDNYSNFIDTLCNLVEQADIKFSTKGQVGIGMPGLIDTNNHSLCANISCANGRNVAADLSTKLHRNIVIENDCRCFALSEATGGAGDKYSSVYGAVIGTGTAGALVINGQLYKGHQGIAGEHGHLSLPATMQQKYQLTLHKCGCGLTGCFEKYIAGAGILYLHRHFGGDAIAILSIVDRWRKGDAIASKTFECYIDLLGACFANLIMLNDPEIIVLGGGISHINEIVEQLASAIEKYIFPNFNAPEVVLARFGDASGVRGAAILASQIKP